MRKPKVSVIMSCYNENSNLLKLSVESIINQTFEDFEFLIALDKPDNMEALEILEYYAKLDSRVKLFVNEYNYGRSRSRNLLVAKSNGTYIAIMDADDISLPNRLKEEIETLEKRDVDVVGSWIAEFNDYFGKNVFSYRKVPEHHKDIVRYAKFRSPVNHATALFKKNLFIYVEGYDESLHHGEDYHLFVKMIKHGASFYNIQDVLLLCRLNDYFRKRRGLKIFKQDYLLMKKIYNLGFLNRIEFLANLALRLSYRILPDNLFKKAFDLQRRF
ncbi:MAG: glycosyltransferase [bacterium]